MKKDVIKVEFCRICHSPRLYEYLSLGAIPIPNGFVPKNHLKKEEKKYPLDVVFCEECSLSQLGHIVDASIMFKNYLYIPSSSQTRLNFFKELANTAKTLCTLSEKSLVVDIGSNDGSLLNCFKNLDIGILGVDPAENLVTVAEYNGIPTIKGYFTRRTARKIIKEHKKAKVALATNVFAHIHDLHEFMKGLQILLENDGVFISHFPYVKNLLEENQFDTIYHEHLSYFSIKSLLRLAESTDFEIFNIEKNELDGGSIRVYWKKKGNKTYFTQDKLIKDLVREEETFGLYTRPVYDQFSERVRSLKKDVMKELVTLKKKKKSIIGYGAAAKGNILLNYFGIGNTILDYLVDSTPYKQGLYSPGTHIPIYSEDKIKETKPDYILILAWNFKDEIMKKNADFRKKGGKFIIVIPEFIVI